MKSYSQSLQTSRRSRLRQIGLQRLRGRRLSVGVILLSGLLFFSANKLFGNNRPEARRGTKRIKAIVDRFRHDLSIGEEVFISVVAKNDRLVSVERSKERRGAFTLSFDDSNLPSSRLYTQTKEIPWPPGGISEKRRRHTKSF